MQVDEAGKVWVMLHTGSRGFGWNIAKQFFVDRRPAAGPGAARARTRSGSTPTRPTGKAYWNLHNMAANFAIANRLLIGEAVCEALEHVFGGEAKVYYEISHNLIQREGGRFVARKGATRAFPKRPPGTRRARSGSERPPHPHSRLDGDGQRDSLRRRRARRSRSIRSTTARAGPCRARQAKKNLDQKDTDLRMAKLGVVLNTRNTPLDESGPCYKDLEHVLGAVELAGLAHVERRLRPVACIKGND